MMKPEKIAEKRLHEYDEAYGLSADASRIPAERTSS